MTAAAPEIRPNTAEFTVSELSAALRRTVEDAYGHVRVRGEISGFRGPHSSGHCYFALKDQTARIEAVIAGVPPGAPPDPLSLQPARLKQSSRPLTKCPLAWLRSFIVPCSPDQVEIVASRSFRLTILLMFRI